MSRERFDYSKCKYKDYEYFGFHLKNGRYHIDTKRLKILGCEKGFPEELFTTPRNTHYFIPKHKNKFDYGINILLETIDKLTIDWNTEYQDAISGIKTPKQVQEDSRAVLIAESSGYDEEVEFNSIIDGINRINKYYEVIKSIHLQYIQKISVEYFRAILVMISNRGYENRIDFDFKDFCRYVNKITRFNKRETNSLFTLPHYKDFTLLKYIDNFLKHNSKNAYYDLAHNSLGISETVKTYLSKFVYSSEETGYEYENGMYAGDWLKIDGSFINNILVSLREFSKELCGLLYGENENEAAWNYDKYLISCLRKNVIYNKY